ncbi:Glycolipid transfer protein superfamily [Arabidopsis suecica]|uniref:Glycolipid transfer protein superfamily n=1 Tax=Arabidopsis suecica TaxID=45249 RepID=A0A8T1XNB4_ARASU|nr:Glycolipid transfer protein superfamily [Arabidopsis suecica]
MKFKEIADAFRELAVIVNTPNSDVPVKLFSHACSRFFLIFTVLKPAFKFAENDYVSKVNDLAKASPSTLTLEAMVDRDIEAKRVRKVGSHTRKLLRVKRGLEMIRVLCEETLATEADSPLKDAAYKAYNQVFGPHHGWAIQLAASTGFGSLLLKAELYRMFNETEETAKIHIQSYVSASASVIAYVDDNLFLSRNLGIDW